MSYRIQHKATGLWLVWNKEKNSEEWQAEKEGSTPLTKQTAVELAKKLGLQNKDYRITNEHRT